MTCSAIIAGLGYECRELDGGILEVDTEFTFADGECVGLYMVPIRNGYALSDNGDAIAHLMSVGIPFRNKRSMVTISRLMADHGVALTPRGELRTECRMDALGDGIARFLSAMIELGRFERDRFGLSEAAVVFSDEVELYLRGWKPHAELIGTPTATGATGGKYEFDFLFEGQLIDCIAAKGRSTGALLRKAADVRARENAPGILAIIDDRTDQEHASKESSILTGSGLVNVMLMTRLMRHSAGQSTQH